MNDLLEKWICNHGHITMRQDAGLVIYIATYTNLGYAGNEAHYVETLAQARKALGY